MKPRSIQDLNAIGCCCPFPECPDPRKECESITITMCALHMPDHDDFPEDSCLVYYKVDVIDHREQSGYNTGDSWFGDPATAHREYSETNTYTCRTYIDPETQDCLLWPVLTRNQNSDLSYLVTDADSIERQRTDLDYDCTQENPILGDGSCTGTYTLNYTAWPATTPTTTTGDCEDYSPCFVSTIVINGCNTAPLEGSALTILDDYVTFTKTEIPASSTATMPAEETFTFKYWIWNTSVMLAMLAEKTFPGDVNGIACSSYMFLDGLCDSPTAARKARYRFGVPESYVEVDAPNVVYEMQWDEVFASHEWWTWFDGGMEGTEPTPGPELRNSREWIWDPEGDEWSPWYILEAPSSDGEVRVVNVLIVCWKSERLGTLPTEYGDQVGGLV